jgi:hypothetical protein
MAKPYPNEERTEKLFVTASLIQLFVVPFAFTEYGVIMASIPPDVTVIGNLEAAHCAPLHTIILTPYPN